MKGSKQNIPFRKTAACPSSATLAAYSGGKLLKEGLTLVSYHLDACEFCVAELTLLSRYHNFRRPRIETPEIPTALRILAESILNRS